LFGQNNAELVWERQVDNDNDDIRSHGTTQVSGSLLLDFEDENGQQQLQSRYPYAIYNPVRRAGSSNTPMSSSHASLTAAEGDLEPATNLSSRASSPSLRSQTSYSFVRSPDASTVFSDVASWSEAGDERLDIISSSSAFDTDEGLWADLGSDSETSEEFDLQHPLPQQQQRPRAIIGHSAAL
jgi:hypothetical protein